VPTWKDFVRCCDLIKLGPSTLEVARLLVEQAPKAGWTHEYYLGRLKRCSEQPGGPPVTFLCIPHTVACAPYDRRLWSFQGPPEYRSRLLPMHLRYLREG
jgi:hypothetical protein